MYCMLVTLTAAIFIFLTHLPNISPPHKYLLHIHVFLFCFVLFCPIAFKLGCRSDTVLETIPCSLDDSLVGKQLNTLTTPSSDSFSGQLVAHLKRDITPWATQIPYCLLTGPVLCRQPYLLWGHNFECSVIY